MMTNDRLVSFAHFKRLIGLSGRTWEVNDTKRQGECVGQKVSTDLRTLPSIPFISPPSPSVILSIPSVPSPLSGSVQSLADADKRMLPVMEKDQRSRLSGGGGGRRCRGGRASVLERHCGRSLFFLGSLLIRRLPRSSLLSLRSSSVHLFLGLWLLVSSLKRGNVTGV